MGIRALLVQHYRKTGECERDVGVIGAESRLPDLQALGYGEWTGFASATLIGVERSARAAVDEIVSTLRGTDAASRS